jgi:hypothetical protein
VVGDLELRSRRLPIVADALGGAEGVLGTEGMQNMRIFIDFRHDKIRISRSHAEPPPPGFVKIKIDPAGGLLLIADIHVGRVPAKAIIDTGSQTTFANLPMREALIRRLRPENVKADRIEGATLDVQYGDGIYTPPIAIGDLTIHGMHITVGDIYIFQQQKMTTEPILWIGMDILGLLDTLIIDFKRHELHVKRRDDGLPDAGAGRARRRAPSRAAACARAGRWPRTRRCTPPPARRRCPSRRRRPASRGSRPGAFRCAAPRRCAAPGSR